MTTPNYPNTITPSSGSALTAFSRQAFTPDAGFPLVNGTPNIVTWAIPNDGHVHRHLIIASESVISAMTGGVVTVNFQDPNGDFFTYTLFNGSVASPGFNGSEFTYPVICKPGSTVFVSQASPLSAGAATVWAEIWGS